MQTYRPVLTVSSTAVRSSSSSAQSNVYSEFFPLMSKPMLRYVTQINTSGVINIFLIYFQGPERGLGRGQGKAQSSSASAALVQSGAERGAG